MRKLLLVILFLPLCIPAQNGDSLFAVNFVHDIRLSFTQPDYWDTLLANKTLSDQGDTDIYIPAQVLIDGRLLDSVGTKLKGNASFGHPGMKKPLKLSFNQYVSGQKYDGLKAIHLNNSAYDPTMLREKLMLDVLNAHGLPAPRCSFAAVYFNNVYIGLYSVVEAVDKTFLTSRFNDNRGNLFKGDPAGTLQYFGSNQSAYYSSYELKTNETQNDWSDLVQLTDVINNSGSVFPQSIRTEFDIDNYLYALAANDLFVNLDSYLFNPHNYYLYHDSIDLRFRWISWDVGLSFGVFPLWASNRSEDLEVFYIPSQSERVPLNVHSFASEELKKIYLDEYCTLLNQDFDPRILFPRIDSLANLIRSFVYAEDPSNKMYTTDQFEGNLGYTSYSAWIASDIPGLKSFVSQRRGQVAQQLCDLGYTCALGNGAQQLQDPQIAVFPNPSPGKITVFFQSPDERVNIYYRLCDMNGKVLFAENVPLEHGYYSREIDLGGYAQGVYVLRVIGGCDEVEQKIVIVK